MPWLRIVELDLRDLRDLPSPPFGGEAVYAIVGREDDLLGACFVPALPDAEAVAAHLAEKLGDEWRERAVAAAVGDPDAWEPGARRVTGCPATVAVCTADRLVSLRRCLTSLRPQLADDDELLVVDNSTAGTAREVAEAFGARWVCERRPGSSWARNRAIDEARHELVAFIDDDCVADRQWLAAILEPFADAGVDAVTGGVLGRRVDLEIPMLIDERYPFHRGWERQRYAGTTGTVDSPFDAWRAGTGASMAFRSSILGLTGGFDPALGAGTRPGGIDDLDLFRRLLAKGGTIAYQPEALVLHDHPETLRGLRRMLIRYAVCQGAQLAKILVEERRGRRVATRATVREWRDQLRWARREGLHLVLRRPRFPLIGLLAHPPAMAVGAIAFLRHRRALRRAVI
ncbi:MAG: hypothetical protein QOC95_1496 [Thermoleophilaceae bacterium]|jgi:GT2 family glycosyltransferase|nr:hypothetical protein [Thermoleophilaceae bacterium]